MTAHSASNVGEFINVIELLIKQSQQEDEEIGILDPGLDFGEGWWFDDIEQLPNGAVLIKLMDVTRGYGDDGLLGEAHQDNIISADKFLDFLRKYPPASRLQFAKYWYEEKDPAIPLEMGEGSISRDGGDSNIFVSLDEP